MKIEKLELSNYRCFPKVSLKLKPSGIIVGENNIGKSTLLNALQLAASLPINSQFPVEYWPDSDPGVELSLGAEFVFGAEEMEKIAYDTDFSEGASGRLSGEEFTRRFGNQAILNAIWNRPNESSRSTLKIFRPGITSDIDYNLGGYSSNQGRLRFGQQTLIALRTVMLNALIFVPEFRQRPQASADEVFRAPQGTLVTAVLFSLKNGTREQQIRYHQIKDHFSRVFPTLKMELTRAGGPPRIMIENSRTLHEVPLDTLGAGIAEMIIILTHVEGETGKVFLIDEPELHLHPHSQRLLRRVLEEAVPDNQVIMVTHSSHFIDLRHIERIILVRQHDGKSQVVNVQEGSFSEDEERRISRIAQSEEKEFLFARRVLLVEGPTEYGAMPILARKIGRDFDENGVSVVSVGGNYFGLFLKLLHAYSLPWKVMCDRDVLMTISGKTRLNDQELKTSRFFQAIMGLRPLREDELKLLSEAQGHIISRDHTEVYQDQLFDRINALAAGHSFHVISPDFEGFMGLNGCEELLREGQLMFGKNKVLQGRFVAEEVTNVPQELRKVISEVTPDIT